MDTLAFSPRDFIQEICKEENIQCDLYSQNYIVRLTKGGVTRHVVWSRWDINNTASDRIACDKSACYIVLSESGVPAIPHEILLHPYRREGWTGEKGTWQQALDFFNAHKKVVVKPNQGTYGRGVHLCQTIQELETAVHAIFETEPDAAISPFYEIETEYRVFYVKGDCPLVYGKTPGEDSWQHNLAKGATAFEVFDEKKLAKLKELASRAAKAVGINFATIDVAETPAGELAIMEINSGIQAGLLLKQLPHLRPVVKNIYAAAVRGMFE